MAQALQLTTGMRVAIKRMSNLFVDVVDCKRILREIVLLRQMNHPCIVKLIDLIIPDNVDDFDEIYMVLEFGESDLKKLMRSSVNLEMLHVESILWNLLHAIKYLHESKILHRDLKPANVLINEDCSIKVCDFGLARTVDGIADLSKKFLGEDVTSVNVK